jgi:5-methylcytosine-specific restriction endonuclease McrA
MKGCTHNIHACADATLERRQTKNAAGVVLHCLQCLNCGRHTCHKVKRDGTEPPELDLELARRGEEALRQLYTDAAEQQKRDADAAKEQWRAEYQEYLRTPQWAALRERVKQRDKICQGCLAAPIEEVHHLTYDHVKEEFAFELVGLCRKCHARLHEVAA